MAISYLSLVVISGGLLLLIQINGTKINRQIHNSSSILTRSAVLALELAIKINETLFATKTSSSRASDPISKSVASKV